MALLFFLCLLAATLAVPLMFISGGTQISNLALCIPFSLLILLPTRLFWEGSQPSALTFFFEEGRYELHRGFRRFSQIDHLTVWSKQENSVDISYNTSLTWSIKQRPMAVHMLKS